MLRKRRLQSVRLKPVAHCHWASRILKLVARIGRTALKHVSGHRASANVEPCVALCITPLLTSMKLLTSSVVNLRSCAIILGDRSTLLTSTICRDDQPTTTRNIQSVDNQKVSKAEQKIPL